MEQGVKKRLALFTGSSVKARKIIILLCSVAAIAGFFMLPAYNEWMRDHIVSPLRNFKWESERMDPEYRMKYRFDSAYIYSKQIDQFFEKKGIKNTALVLLPTTNYFKQHNVGYDVPEPAVFYYFTGLKTLWINCSNVADANWYVRADNGKIIIDSVTNRKSLLDTIAMFNKIAVKL